MILGREKAKKQTDRGKLLNSKTTGIHRDGPVS